MSNRRLMTKPVALKPKPARGRPFQIALDAVAALPAYTLPRWICNHHSETSDIEAWVMATKSLEIIAQTRQAEGIDARANAEFIVQAVNGYEKLQQRINELAAAFELCLASDTLSWEAEQEAELVLGRVRGKG